MERKEMEHKSTINATQLPGDDGIDRRGMLECTFSWRFGSHFVT
jgi:hypothetical protein